MKDLFVMTADADAQALLRSLLERHRALKIRPIEFDVRRFTGRDPGMVKEGPEIARVLVSKSEYSRLILILDHHGSGRESQSPERVVTAIQERLEGVTWAGKSAAIVLVPELEEWLWHCPAAIAKHLRISEPELDELIVRCAPRLAKPPDRCRLEAPKELFEAILYQRERRRPLPEDFETIGKTARLSQWQSSQAFATLTRVLQAWFPI